jgi:hypothetical protein
MLTMVLIEGLSHAKKKSLYPEKNAEGTRVSCFVSDIESLINRTILGTKDDPCQWMCPFDAQKKEIGPITMNNVCTRKVIDSLDTIVSFCVTDQGCKSLWTNALESYWMAMVLLWKKRSFYKCRYCIISATCRPILSGVGHSLAEGGNHKLYSHDWVWAHCRVSIQAEESPSVLTTKLGGYEFIDQDFLL